MGVTHLRERMEKPEKTMPTYYLNEYIMGNSVAELKTTDKKIAMQFYRRGVLNSSCVRVWVNARKLSFPESDRLLGYRKGFEAIFPARKAEKSSR